MCNNSSYRGKISKKLMVLIVFAGLVAVLVGVVCCQYERFLMLLAPLYFRANYTPEYVEKNRGKVVVEIPEVYELANIAIAISDYGLKEPHRVYKHGEYYERVLKHFMPFKNHPLISEPVFDDNLSCYYGFRENSVCYVFEGDSIVPGGIYLCMWYPNLFEKQRVLVEDFSKVSRFREFYRNNFSYYQEQARSYKEKVPVRKMWSWLEKNFPDRYDCYKVVFSPLIGGSHSAQRFKDKDFRESIMFVSGPRTNGENFFDKVAEGLLSRVVFTEIGHNYVNPVTDKYSNKVNKVFSNVDKWNRQGGYRSPYSIFNEYMTWAVFTLYAHDNYEEEDFQMMNQKMVKQMVNSRKFVLFRQFDEELLELYLNRGGGETVSDLYPKILAWAESM